MATAKNRGSRKYVVWLDGSKTPIEAADGKFLVLEDERRVRLGNPAIREIIEEKPKAKAKKKED